MTPLRAIRQFCIQCCGNNQKAPALCASQDCALYPYRLGTNPKRKGIGGRRNGGEIMPTQVAKTRREIVVSGHKRIIIEDIEELMSKEVIRL